MTAQITASARRARASAAADEYLVRPFAADDESAVLSLAGGPRPGGMDRAWFDWCCRENPAVDHVPMAVVERDGDVVGALPFLPVRVRAGDRIAVAAVPGDVVAGLGRDPEAIRDRAIEGAVEYYGAAAVANRPPTDVDVVTSEGVDGDAAATIDDPPAFVVVPGEPDGGETTDGESDTADADEDDTESDEHDGPSHDEVRYDRLQRHGAFLARKIPGPPGRWFGTGVSAVTSRVRRWRDGRADFDTEPFTVMRHAGVPDATLGACYEASRPASTHVVLDEPFFDWWYAQPGTEPATTYVAYRGSEVAAGIVARRAETDGVDCVTITHVVPLAGDPERPSAVAAGLDRLLDEHRDAHVIRSRSAGIPEPVRGAYGFRRADSLPTSLLVNAPTRTLDVRPVVEHERTVGPRPIGEAASTLWTLV